MERALVIQTAFLGDAVLGTALLERIHAEHPKCRVDYLVRKGNEGLFAGHPFLNQVLTFDKSRKVAELWRLIATIRAARYDVVINAQRFASSGLITVLSDAQQTVGYDRNPFSMFFGRKVDHPMSNGHEVDRLLELHSSSSETGRVLPRIYPSSEDERIASSHIKSPFITVAPASVWFTKQWPEAKWAEFIRQVPEHYDVLLTGGPGDVTLCERIGANAGRRVTVVAGKLTLLQTAVLMSKATMNYANDSAPVHLASAMNAPICEIFCSTVPGFGFTPLSDEAHIIETEEKLSCRPCGIHGHRSCPEGHFRCADISPQRLSALLK
jgi:ADP-heptose:LPS heptosyltransferase